MDLAQVETVGHTQLSDAIAQLSPEQLAFIQATVDAVVRATVPPKITSASNTSELFSSWLGSRESVQTERAYRNDVMHFVQYKLGTDYPDLDDLNLHTVTKEDVDGYKAFLLKQENLGQIARASVRRRLASLKSFLRYGCDVGYLRTNSAMLLKVPTERKKIKERTLSETEIEMMSDAALLAVSQAKTQHKKILAQRNQLVFELFYCGGFRVGEVATLTWSSVYLNQSGLPYIKVVGKGDKERDVLLPTELYQYLLANRQRPKDKTEPVFISQKTNKPVGERHIRRIIKSIAQGAGLSRIPSPHWLRHSHATHAAKHTPIHVITKTLGHSSGKITLDNYLHAGEDEASSLNLRHYRR
ncbi:tyrosine-type recombinase/integrase [Nostoc sp. FACHB-190]|uniref:tyrosine-type recombinase/integrase n=1 Tax=Nostoc sp. FACHB-190 TaxID=2692838 RepID=UPI0016857AF1|nr:tyrosine-type recombinase/integrase [Nostoc sp. FACHB-190]MBD2302302.1 tyrosine-type recombinase/integrase [Nostoc sp. FACHB-190]